MLIQARAKYPATLKNPLIISSFDLVKMSSNHFIVEFTSAFSLGFLQKLIILYTIFVNNLLQKRKKTAEFFYALRKLSDP